MVRKVIGDCKVEPYTLRDLDVSTLSNDPKMQKRMRDLKCKNREVFKRFARTNGVKHRIKLNAGAQPICCTTRQRLPKDEYLERTCMRMLMKMAILKHSISSSAENSVFLSKKDHGTKVTTDYRFLSSVKVTDACPTEDVYDTLYWKIKQKNVLRI